MDHKSRYAHIELLHSKSSHEALKVIKNYKSYAKLLRVIRTDNARELNSSEINEFLLDNDIVREFTSPHSPQQNSIAESCFRRLYQIARQLIDRQQLSKDFFGFALIYAAEIWNHTIRFNQRKTPYQLFFGKKPNLEHFRVFGCKCHVKRINPLKHQSRSETGVFIGFPRGSKAWIVYLPSSNKIITSRNVTFEEDVSGATVLTEGEQSNTNSEISASPVTTLPTDQPTQPSSEQPTEQQTSQLTHQSMEQLPEQPSDQAPEINQPNDNSLDQHFQTFTQRLAQLGYPVGTSEINHLTLEEALVSPEKEHWKEAMKKEVKTLEDMGAWEPVSEIPQGHTPIDTKWVLKKKTDGSGNLVRYKARLVARGFKAKKGTHYQSTFSPVLNFATLRTLLALAVLLGIVPMLADVTNAYIHAEVINLVYITLPWGQKARLLKALYGMPDSAQLWYNKLKSILLSLGYQRSISDPAVFIKDTRPKTFNVIGIYVDDTIILIRNNDERQQLLTNLRKRLDITTQEVFNLILGINFSLTNNCVKLTAEKYISQLARKWNIEKSKKVYTPISGQLRSTESTPFNPTTFQELLGSLLFISNAVRPDIAFSVNYLSTFNKQPTKHAFKALKRILIYLFHTRTLGLVYKASGSLLAYSDSDFANDESTRTSRSGSLVLLAGAPIHWRSQKQRLVTLSTSEAEYIAFSETTRELLHLRNLLTELGRNNTPTVYCDN